MGFTFGSTHPTDGLARAPRRSSHRTAGLLGMTGLHGTTDFTQGRPPGAPAMAAIGRRPPRPASPRPNPPALRPRAAPPSFRSEERRVGKEGVSPWRSRWAPSL